MKLVIFDLDQTLVDFISAHDKTTKKLFKEYFGVEAKLTEIDFAGRSLRENFTELARLKGVSESEIEEKGGNLLDDYDRVLCENLPPNASKNILPGVSKLLIELSKTDNLLVLYTGDSPLIVDCVFKATNLGKYFKFAVYGTEAVTRVGIAKLAIEKAEKMAGIIFTGKDVVIIGDSVRDVECGKQLNALTIAVATGFHSEATLAEQKPNYIFKDFSDYKKVLAAIR